MSERRVVLRGSIRVDARRARAKLREHLLLDLHGYSLELARAAVAIGATSMNVRWDADDVVFAFDGPALSAERLARLLDFALSDAEDEHAAPLRSLALGVNAALGLGADLVTVTSTDDAAAWAMRFTPDLFADEDEARPELEARACSRPRDAFTRGTHVHVKKRLGLDVLRRAVSSSVPPEIALLIASTGESPLALTCDGAPVVRPPEPPLVARVPFTLPGARRAAVELRASGAPCHIDVMERGVRLLSLSWLPLPGLAATPALAPPVRVLIDADELPTNASRSSLREDTPLARELLPASEAAFRKLLEALTARATGAALPDGVEVLSSAEDAWRDALGALTCLAAHALRAGNPLDPAARALLEIPLLESAGGGRISVGRVLGSPVVRVWKGDEPLPDELSPWLGDVVWLRGYLVERVLDDANVEDAGGLVKRARAGAARRARFLAHAPAALSVPESPAVLARRRVDESSGPCRGLSGEVALLAPLPAGATRPSLLRVFVEGRMLEALPIEPSFCPLAFDAAVAWPGGFRPRFDYDGVDRDARLGQAVHAVSLVAIDIADRAAARLPELEGVERAGLERVLRDAVAAWSVVPARLGQTTPPPRVFRRNYARLHRAEIFPVTSGGRVSLRELGAWADERKALCVVPSWQEGAARPAPDGRPVLVASGAESEAMLALLDGKVERIPYERGVSTAGASGDTPEGRRAALARAVSGERVRQGLSPLSATLWFERDGAITLVAPGVTAASIESHRGVILSCTPRKSALSSLIVATDDPACVPNPAWTGVHWTPKRHPGWFEQRFGERLVDALEGDAEARASLELVSPLTSEDLALVLCLLARAISIRERIAARAGKPERPLDSQARALLERIERLPILCSLDDDGVPLAVSVADIAARHQDTVPLLDRVPGFPTGDWRPLIARHERERELLGRRFVRVANGELELDARRQRALVEQRRRGVLAQPARDIRDLDSRVRPGDPLAHLRGVPQAALLGDLDAAVALPHPALAPGLGWVSVRFDGRPLGTLGPSDVGLPLVGNVSSSRVSDFVDFACLSPDGLARVGGRLREAAFELCDVLAQQGLLLSDSRALSLCLALCDVGAGDLVRERFSRAEFGLPTVQGGEAPLSLLATQGSALMFGSERYPGWLAGQARASDLDSPILFLPPGDLGSLLSALLGRLGYQVSDVSAALAALQRQRGGGAAAAPKLDGLPPHPVMRASLWEVGVTAGDGEVELVRGPKSTLGIVLLDGRTESWEGELACPVRAVIRVDAIDASAVRARVLAELEDAAQRLLVLAVAKLDQLPEHVRHSTRRLLCLCAESRDENALAAAAVFEDTGGFWHSLGGLSTAERWQYTTLEPPFPPSKQPTLRLTEAEATGLRPGIELVKIDGRIERAREAERRRTAPQVASLMLSAELRAACILTVPVKVEGTSGEVGVLGPARPELRGGTLYVERRALCAFEDGEGWPLVSVLNDDGVEPDRFFEGPADRGVLVELAKRARDVARLALKRTFAPSNALAARWLEDEAVGGFRVTGCLWLGTTFPAAPRVRVYAGQQVAPMVRALEARRESSSVGLALPLEGDLLVRWVGGPEGSDAVAAALASALATLDSLTQTWSALGELGERIAVELVGEARARGVDAPALDEHALSLALLDLKVEVPALSAADGSALQLADVLEELDRTGMVWTSDGRAFVEGAFPGAAPSFFLPERSPLVSVLSMRLAKGRVRALGGVAEVRAVSAPVLEVQGSDVPVLAPPKLEFGEPSWWARLTARLGQALADEEPTESTTREQRALLDLVTRLSLAGTPVQKLALGRAKRALRYDPKAQRLLLNPAAPAAAALAGSKHSTVCVMAAHAVCEVNRALVEVTDGEEQRALLALLKEL